MTLDPTSHEGSRRTLEEEIGSKQRRKLRARKEGDRTVWFGLGMFGLVGWSVAAPTLLGIALGLWIDSRWPSRFSWTLMFLLLGLVIGCLNAWGWVRRESEEVDESEAKKD